MLFWMAVLTGALFAWIAVEIGFYATWIMLFNLVLSAYVAIFLSPVIIANIPAATSTPYGYALILISTASATLLIAYGICYACLSGELRAEFPRVFDNIAAGLLGFLSGFLVWSFVSFSVCLTPLTEISAFKTLGFEGPSQTTNTSYLCWWCDLVHAAVASSDTELTSEEAVSMLLAKAKPRATEEPAPGTLEQPAQNKSPAQPPPEKAATQVP
jgi:hypothetical protein